MLPHAWNSLRRWTALALLLLPLQLASLSGAELKVWAVGDMVRPLRKDFPLRGRFSRAEQTHRALNQDVERFYLAEDMEHGGKPQEVARVEVETHETGEAQG